MREPYYENQGANTYLVYCISPEDELDTMSLGMLTNNKIPGFAVASFMQMDADKFIKYNVSSKVSAAQLFTGPVNKKRLIGFLTGIVNAMISAEEYMIDPATVLLDMDYIFSDVSTCETILICLPIMKEDSQAMDLGTFFKNVIFRTQFDQSENCDHVAQIINYLNAAPVLSLVDFKALLDRLSGKATPVAQPAPAPAPQPAPAPAPAPAPQPAPVQPQRPVAPVQPQRPVAPVQPQHPAAPVQPQRPVPPAPGARPVPPAPGKAPAGFAVPGKAPAAAPAAPAAPEKEISFMYLMQHYNKENAAAYKAQQEAKKAQKGAGKAAPAAPAAPVPGKAPTAPMPNPGYAVPGQAPGARPVPPAPGARPVPPAPGARPVPPAPGARPVPPVQPVARPMAQPVPQPVAQPAPQPIPQPVPQPAPQPMNMNFGETTVLGGGGIGETTVLGAAAVEAQTKPHLIRSKNNERINLDKPVFRIGKEKSYVDYFIGDNTAISRSHANIISRDGEYFVVDTNSTNHTYVNGGMIQSNVETKISHDTKIRLANEEFTFKMY